MIALALPAAKLRAALDGTLTEIRSPVAPMPGEQSRWLTSAMIGKVPHGEIINGGWQMHHPKAGTFADGVHVAHDSPLGWVRCPLGAPGALLWVKETCILPVFDDDPDQVVYAADHADPEVARSEIQDGADGDVRWRPAICMPRWASRLAFRNRGARVERDGDIWTWVAAVERVDRPDGTPMPPREIGGAS